MKLQTNLAILIGSLSLSSTSNAVTAGNFEKLANEGAKNFQTREGQQYEREFEKVFVPVFGRALRECENEPDTKQPAMIVFVIAADGRVKQELSAPNIRFGDCIAAKLRSIKTLPRPPRDNWIVSFGAANHHHEEAAQTELQRNAPRDRPVKMTAGADLAAYDKAISPHIVKAKATYPEAKRRFQAGLPVGCIFLVRTRLSDSRGVVEDCLIEVENIRNGQISGKINRVDLLNNYKSGQRITFSEKKIDNWIILHPDGTEEGNYVGKFLDQYKRQ